MEDLSTLACSKYVFWDSPTCFYDFGGGVQFAGDKGSKPEGIVLLEPWTQLVLLGTIMYSSSMYLMYGKHTDTILQARTSL